MTSRTLQLQISAKTIWTIALPLVVSGFHETIIEVSDTAFLARVGVIELGAAALAYSIYHTAKFLMIGLGDGIQILTARRAGQARPQAIGDAFNHGLILLLATAAVLFAGLRYVAPWVTASVLRSTEVRIAVDQFLGIIAFAVFFDALNYAYVAFYSGIGRTRVFIAATGVMTAINLVTDYALILGRLGFPRLGIRGAAISSVIAEVTIFVFLTAAALKQGHIRRFGLFRLPRPAASLTKLLLELCTPLALERLVGTARWFLFFVVIERIGETPLATANIIYSCYAVFLIIIDGFSEANCTLVSNLIGQDQPERMNAAIRSVMMWTAVCIAPFLAIAVLFPTVVLSLFTADASLLHGSVNSLRVIAVAVLAAIPGELVFSALIGTGDTRATLAIECLLTACVLGYVFGAALIFELPLEIVWAAEIIGWLLSLGLSLAWLSGKQWKRIYI